MGTLELLIVLLLLVGLGCGGVLVVKANGKSWEGWGLVAIAMAGLLPRIWPS